MTWPAFPTGRNERSWSPRTNSSPKDDHQYEFDLVRDNLCGTFEQWIPELLIPARDLALELALALDLQPVLKLLAVGGYLDRFNDALRYVRDAQKPTHAKRRLREFGARICVARAV